MSAPQHRPRRRQRLLWWEIPAAAGWLVILAASCFAADAWRTLVRTARQRRHELDLWVATVAGVLCGFVAADKRPPGMPWWFAMLVAVAASTLAMLVGALAGYLHARLLRWAGSTQEEGDVR